MTESRPARRAVELRIAALGPQHPAVAADQAALAGVLAGLGRAAEAEDLLQQALHVLEETLGMHHADVAAALNNLAAIHQQSGKLNRAEHE